MYVSFLVAALAQSQVPLALTPVSAPPTEVLFDERPDEHRLFAIGSDWKLAVTEAGVSYIPRFGKKAPRNLPLEFGFGDARGFTRQGNRIEIDRGSFIERYDLGIDEIEQSFVLKRHPAGAGAWTFRVPLNTELASAGTDAAGVWFEAGGLGRVVYGHATIVDSANRRCHVEVRRTVGELAIDVPAPFLAAARFPVVIDPVINTFLVDGGTDNSDEPDVAFSDSNDSFATVFSSATSGSDTDLIAVRRDIDGVAIQTHTIDGSTDDASQPSIAESGGQYLVAFRNISSGIGSATRIKARSLSSSGAVGSIFDVSNLLASEESDPDVGGTSGSTPRFVVVWQQESSLFSTRNEIRGILCSNSATIGSDDDIFSPGVVTENFIHPAVNQDSGVNHRFIIAAEFGTTQSDIVMQAVSESMVKQGLPINVTASSTNDGSRPRIAGDGVNFFAVWMDATPTNLFDIRGARVVWTGSALTKGTEVNMSQLDSPGSLSRNQTAPQITFDGCRYSLAYQEDVDVFVSTFLVSSTLIGNPVVLVQSHVALNPTSDSQFEPAVAAARLDATVGADDGKVLINWSKWNVTENDVMGALYSSLGSGGATTVVTNCGGASPTISGGLTGIPSAPVGGTLNLLFGNYTSGLLFVGTPTSVALCPAQASCKLGVAPFITLALPPAPLVQLFEVPCDPSLFGFTMALQIIDTVPNNTTGPLCGPPKFQNKIRVSNTLEIKFQ